MLQDRLAINQLACSILVILAAIVFYAGFLLAQVAPKGEATSTSDKIGVTNTVDQRLDLLEREARELKQKIIKPPKDVWDKLSATSALVSGIAVALIGFYATTIYNRRQKETEERRKEQELTVSQIQTVEKFIPHLSSTNELIKAAALGTIAALGNDELAVKLARIFGGTGSTSALASIAATGPTAGGNAAQRALGDLLQYLKNRVVTLHADKRVATGFIMSGSSLIVTTAHAIDGIPIDDLKAKLPNGQLQTVGTVVVNQDHDLALLFVRSYESFSAIEFNGLPPEIGEPVMALVIRQEDDELVVAVGSVFMVHATVKISFGDRDRWVENRIAVSIRASPGDSGAPVLDRQGRLIGIVEAGDEKYTFLIPLSEINSLMSKVNEI